MTAAPAKQPETTKAIDANVALEFYMAQCEWLRNWALLKGQAAFEANQALVALAQQKAVPATAKPEAKKD